MPEDLDFSTFFDKTPTPEPKSDKAYVRDRQEKVIELILEKLTDPAPAGFSIDLVHFLKMAEIFHLTELVSKAERQGWATSEQMRKELLLSLCVCALSRVLNPSKLEDTTTKYLE
jgi:hypothetical protein